MGASPGSGSGSGSDERVPGEIEHARPDAKPPDRAPAVRREAPAVRRDEDEDVNEDEDGDEDGDEDEDEDRDEDERGDEDRDEDEDGDEDGDDEDGGRNGAHVEDEDPERHDEPDEREARRRYYPSRAPYPRGIGRESPSRGSLDRRPREIRLTPHLPIEIDGWLSRSQVAARLRSHPNRVKKREQEGELHPVYHEGKPYFDPEEVDALAPQSPTEMALGDILTNMSAVIKTQMEHNRQILGTSVETGYQMLQLLSADVKAQRTRIAELEAELTRSRQLVEVAETAEHERKLKSLEFERDAERSKRLMSILETNVPSVLSMIGAKVAPGSAATADAQGQALKSLIQSLDAEQLGKIGEVLTTEQRTALGGLMHGVRAEERNRDAQGKAE